MEPNFKQILKELEQQDIQLDRYGKALHYLTDSKLTKLTQKLQKQKINLKNYHHFLEQKFITSSTETFLPLDETEEIQKIKQICFKLINESRLEFMELNSVFGKIPLKNLYPEEFLKQLAQEQKIKAEEFVSFLEPNNQKPIPRKKLENNPYCIKNNANRLELYIDESKVLKRIGSYQVLEELGHGAMGVVYKAYHPTLKQIFALKVVVVKGLDADQQLLRFFREVRSIAKLQHPNIVKIYALGEEEEQKQHYFAMEYVRGQTLEEWLKKDHPIREKVKLFQKCLEALHYSHEQGILHRDLKPQNILVTPENEPKLTDFGLAKDLTPGEQAIKLTQSGIVLGTPSYMSPEQAYGKHDECDQLSDIYSMGICLYEAVTAKKPFESPEIQVLIYKIATVDPLLPSRINPAVHPDLETIILKAIEKQKKRRYANALDFAKDLRRFLRSYPIKAKPPTFQDKIDKWLYHYKKNVIFGIILFSIVLLFLGITSFSKWKAQELHFQKIVQQGIKFQNHAKTIQGNNFVSQGERFTYLLNGLNQLNHALNLKPKDPTTEQIKFNIGKDLILLVCKIHEFKLADYFWQEIELLSSISLNEKVQLKQKLVHEKNKIRQYHLTQFERWIQKLEQQLKPWEKNDILFEISQMQEEEVFKKLLELFSDGKQYILNSEMRNPEREEFYATVIKILGRLENSKAGTPLLNTLKEFDKKLSLAPPSQKKLIDINYMVLLAQALGNLKEPKYFKPIRDLRWKQGSSSIFWQRTKRTYRKLLKHYDLEKLAPKTPSDFIKRASDRQAKKEYQQALEDYNAALILDPNSVAAYTNRGNTRLELGDLSGAIFDYTKAIEIDPNLSIAYMNRGFAKNATGDLTAAIQDYNKAILLRADYGEAYNNRGLAKQGKGDFIGALKDYNEAIRLNPHQIDSFMNRGNVKKKLGDLKGALKDYNETIKLNPQYATAYMNRGAVKQKAKDFEGALFDYTEAIKLNPQFAMAYYNRASTKQQKEDFIGALSDYNEAIRLKPKDLNSYFNRGNVKFLLNKFSEAILDYTQTIELNPKDFEAYYYRGVAKEAIKDFTGAFADFKKVTELNPAFFPVYNSSGTLRQKMKDYQGAIKDFSKAIQLNPNSIVAYKNRGALRQTRKDFEGAEKDFSKIIDLYPNSIIGYQLRGSLRQKRKNYSGSIQDFSTIIRLKPKFVEGYLNRGILNLSLGYFEQAIQDYSIIIQLEPNNAQAFFHRGLAQESKRNIIEAIKDYTKAIKLKTDYVKAYHNRGFLLQTKGNLKDALQDYNQVVHLSPKDPKAYLNRGNVKRSLNDLPGAIADYNQSIQLNPKLPMAYGARGSVQLDEGKTEEARKDFIEYLKLSALYTDPETKQIRQWIFQKFPALKNKNF